MVSRRTVLVGYKGSIWKIFAHQLIRTVIDFLLDPYVRGFEGAGTNTRGRLFREPRHIGSRFYDFIRGSDAIFDEVRFRNDHGYQAIGAVVVFAGPIALDIGGDEAIAHRIERVGRPIIFCVSDNVDLCDHPVVLVVKRA